ncbi:hypothetical protein ScPMuIL_011621 [Solemya velum]
MLYKCYGYVDGFLGTQFAKYGRLVARNPWKITIGSVLINVLLGFGLFRLEVESDALYLFTPLNNRASRDKAQMQQLFPETPTNFYMHTMTWFGRFGEVIIRDRNNKNILSERMFNLTGDLVDYIKEWNVTLDNGTVLNYDGVCARRQGQCVVNGESIFLPPIKHALIQGEATFPLYERVYLRDVLGNPTVADEIVSSAETIKLRFYTREDEYGKQWEQGFRKALERYESTEIEVAYAYSDSLDDEVNANIRGDTMIFVGTIALMMAFASLSTIGGNCLTDRSHLGRVGVFTAVFAIVGAFGLVSAAGMTFVSIVGVAPFLVIGVGLDDMFIMLSGLADTYHMKSLEDRIGETMRTSGMAITITSLTDLLAFSVGASSTFPAIRSFCTYTGVAILFTYINFVTFFTGCMVINEQRVMGYRHSLTCRQVKSQEELKESGAPRLVIKCCGSSQPKSRKDIENPLEKYASKTFTKIVLYEPARLLLVLLYVVYLGFSIWNALYFKEGILLEQLAAEDSHFYKHSVWNTDYYQVEMIVDFVVTEELDYANNRTMPELKNIFNNAMKHEYIVDDFVISWYDAYQLYPLFDNSSEVAFIRNLKFFLKTFEVFANDVTFNANETAIKASRFHVRTLGADEDIQFRDLMIDMRELADATFIYLEQVVVIVPQTIQNLAIAAASIMLVTLFMIPHPLMVVLVTFSVSSIMVGLIGFMQLWGLTLSSITMVDIIMCIGFSIDYSSHIVHAYMQGEGKTREDKVVSAFRIAGGPVFSGVASTFVGIFFLLFAKSYIYLTFFKVIFIVICLGLAHALVFIPVCLTILGPMQHGDKPPVSRNDSINSKLHNMGKIEIPRVTLSAPARLSLDEDMATENEAYVNYTFNSEVQENEADRSFTSA